MPTASNAWHILNQDREDWGPAPFRSLLAGEVAGVVIDNFYPKEACNAIVDNVQRIGLVRSFSGENTVVRYSGLAAIELANRQEDYLAAVAEANRDRHQLLGDHPDPLKSVLRLLRKAWPAGAQIATERGRPYFAGVIRIFKKGAHHTDSAARDLLGWSVAGIKYQLSWNLYLTIPEQGGAVEIWDRHWREADERAYRYDRATKKGYSPEVVDGCRSALVPPLVGRFVIFNALYYHTVLDVTGERPRLAMSSFVGATDESSPLVLWS
jgi:hypothetical protein